jgi:hypothetical protein
MSIEIVLIPLAIALTKEIAEGVSNLSETNNNDFTILDTRMKDESLLKQALEEWTCSFREVEALDSLQQLHENEVTFMMNKEGCYSLVLQKSADKDSFQEWIEKVETSYTHYLQQRVYLNLVEKAKEQGMILENEELFEDHSIQLTYILNR